MLEGFESSRAWNCLNGRGRSLPLLLGQSVGLEPLD
jgi:hypothetical protein